MNMQSSEPIKKNRLSGGARRFLKQKEKLLNEYLIIRHFIRFIYFSNRMKI